MSLRILWLAILAFNSLFVHAFPIAPDYLRPATPALTPPVQYDFEGIVSLSGCSGSIVKFEGQPETDPAYVMTNGHCYEGGFLDPNEFIFGRASSRSFTVLNPSGNDLGRVRATTVVYATMTHTDITLYRTRETFAEIKQRYNIRPLTLAAGHPTQGSEIEVISGFWRRGYSCQIDGFVFKLLEGGWENHDSIRYTRECDVIGGTSGSPIVAKGTRIAVGINNTGNESGGRCTENNPCEIDEKGNVTYTKGVNYGQQTFWLYSCLNARFEIDLAIPGCLLPH